MEQFKIRNKANEGVKVPLVDPATGEETEHWLQIVSQYSDVYREESKIQRRAVTQAIIDGEKYKVDELKMTAMLVKAWSFTEEDGKTPKPCTFQNVYDFLLEAPQLIDSIDLKAVSNKSFFAGKSTSSLNTSGKKQS